MYVWLAGRAAMLAYGPHPKHQELMALQARTSTPRAPFRAALGGAGTGSGSAAMAHADLRRPAPRAPLRPVASPSS